jgi:uncharacterized protein (TIGR03066 family)
MVLAVLPLRPTCPTFVTRGEPAHLSLFFASIMKHKSRTTTNPARPLVRISNSHQGSPWRSRAIIALCLLVPAGGTWAVMEFVVWNKLPSELVGKWEVVQGPPEFDEAEVQFYRSGRMIGHFNDHGNDRPMEAEVRVEGAKLYITTRRPSTGEEHVSVQTIRTLNERQLVVADERGMIIRMARIP